MKTEETDIPPTERTTTPCAGCGRCDGKGWVVWEQPMCNDCKNAWDEGAPPDELWAKNHPEDKARYAAKKAWTAQWAAQRRKAAA